MILTQPDLKAICMACFTLQDTDKKPIIYMSEQNLYAIMTRCSPSKNFSPITTGYVGKLFGVPVYVTDEVLDLIVIVPQLKEESL